MISMLEEDKIKQILDNIEELFPNASCELDYKNIYELTVAVILSAQTTDKAVNLITPILFNKYPDIVSLSKANILDVKDIIKTIGLASTKSINLVKMANQVVDNYHGIIPNKMDELLTLNGIGRKCANVILCEGYRIPAFPVDTHIERISKRMGIVNDNTNVYDIELKLRSLIPEERYHKAHHLFIHFGRYFCTARKPNCTSCFYKQECPYYKNNNK